MNWMEGSNMNTNLTAAKINGMEGKKNESQQGQCWDGIPFGRSIENVQFGEAHRVSPTVPRKSPKQRRPSSQNAPPSPAKRNLMKAFESSEIPTSPRKLSSKLVYFPPIEMKRNNE
eukprot:TRINITY_DN3712_c0_g1_i1.p1 TRINITY_DN3712_c0_g1~~TRINITY_DN3712_c0_g1_i1.p1  ORF type:complete len:116 (+),score=17.71 TRINITY_DN3712_c0_g1_i1:44-391(+)